MCTTYGDPFREIDSARAASLNFPGAERGAKGPGTESDGGMELEAHEGEYMVFEIWMLQMAQCITRGGTEIIRRDKNKNI